MAQGRPWVILTQDEDGAAAWLPALAARALSVRQWPAFQVSPLLPAGLLTHFPREGRLPAGTDAPLIYVLTSPAAVRVLAAHLSREGRRWPAGVWAGVPGRGSASVFRQHFGADVPMVMPEPPWQDGEHLAQAIIRLVNERGALRPGLPGQGAQGELAARVWVFNRPDGRLHWLATLRQQGIGAQALPIYRVQPVPGPPSGIESMLLAHREASDRLHWILGATAPIQTVSAWLASLPAPSGHWGRAQPVWVPHQRLLDVARSAGFESIQVYHDRQQLIEQLQ